MHYCVSNPSLNAFCRVEKQFIGVSLTAAQFVFLNGFFSCSRVLVGLNLPFDMTTVLKCQGVKVEQIRFDIDGCSEWHGANLKSAVNLLIVEQESIETAVEELRSTLASSNVSKCVPTGNLSDFENYIVSLDFFDATSSALVVRGNDLQKYRDSIHSDKSTRNNP